MTEVSNYVLQTIKGYLAYQFSNRLCQRYTFPKRANREKLKLLISIQTSWPRLTTKDLFSRVKIDT